MNNNIARFIVLLFLGFSFSSLGQKEYHIEAATEPPVIDGVIDEAIWKSAEIATDFIDQQPVFGGLSEFVTKVYMTYDDNAFYIAAELFDSSPDSVSYALSQRDDMGNGDWFGIAVDTYGNNVNAFDFMVTAAGVQLDALEGTTNLDFSWNAVWKSVTKKTEYGWSLEIKIPYSAIRFPNKDIQEWNINFWRGVRRRRLNSTWNPIDPNIFGEITQSGKVLGIKNIKSPLRLSFTPYATGYIENSYDEQSGEQTWKQRATGGLDLKYGLNDAFTLDMTLIPDFGQTASDRQVLNLGPFEVQFDENRPFFLEGTDLFRIGGVFYSRRIAATPFNYYEAHDDVDESIGEEVVGEAALAPMINGIKVSGRTNQGLGIGVFNAIEGRSDAIIRDSMGNERKFRTNPYTNYNVIVLSQNLRNNSTVSLVNTHVFREGSSRDANVTVGTANMYTPDGNYRLHTQVKLSSIFENNTTVIGHSIGTNFAKVAGTWRYSFGYGEESNTFDPNDLGFLYNNNSRSYYGELSWNTYTAGNQFYRKSANVNIYYEELYLPSAFSYAAINLNFGGLHKQQFYTNIGGGISPFGSVDHFESREFGKEVKNNPNVWFDYMLSTDYSKRFAVDVRFDLAKFLGENRYGWSAEVEPRVRISDRMNVMFGASYETLHNDYGYVSVEDEAFDNEIILGTRDRNIVENTLGLEFIFTKRMGIDLRLRHYWQQVRYVDFRQLLDEGEMIASEYNPLDENGMSVHNTSYNAFTLDINYSWVFLPGSELRIVYKNNLFHSKSNLDSNYFQTFETLFEQPQINSISLKVLFYVDALYFKRKNKKKRN
ncbi:MAG: DUF5916 domain-containing protein [Crocinitomicaceae bacterium]|nr:DUF5916 domain-containing protein [Crocinitomicaceae bacterium]